MLELKQPMGFHYATHEANEESETFGPQLCPQVLVCHL